MLHRKKRVGLVKAKIAALIITIALPLYAFEGWINYREGVGSVGADYWVIQKYRMQGIDAVPYYAPMARYVRNGQTLDVSGTPSVPLFSIANKFNVVCREGDRPFAAFMSDRYGYNNPDSVWDHPIDIVTLGDSFTIGACVNPKDHSVNLIREKFPRLANQGVSGSGPIMQAAILREFIAKTQPKLVIWFYDEHNDVFVHNLPAEAADMLLEYNHPILGRYQKEPGFRQNVLEKMNDFQAALNRDVYASMRGIKDNTLRRNTDAVLRFLTLTKTRAQISQSMGAHAAEEDVRIRLFRVTMGMIMQEVRSVDSRLLVVKLPSNVNLCDHVRDALTDPTEEIIKASGADFLDLESAMRAAVPPGKESSLFALKCGGHYSELGNQIVAEATIAWLTAHGY